MTDNATVAANTNADIATIASLQLFHLIIFGTHCTVVVSRILLYLRLVV